MHTVLNRLYDRFTRHIQVRLTSYFLLILLPLVLVGLFANARSQQIVEHKTGERTKGTLLSAAEYIDLIVQNVDNLSMLISTNTHLIGMLERAGPEPGPQSILDFTQIFKDITETTSIHQTLAGISVLHLPSEYMIISNYGGKRIQGAREHEAIRMAIEGNGARVVYSPTSKSDTLDGTFTGDRIYFLRTMDLYNRYRQPNILMLSVKKETLLKLMGSLLPSRNAQIYLHTAGGELVVGTEGEQAPPLPALGGENIAVPVADGGEERMLTVRAQARYSNWSLTMMQPESELNRETGQLRLYTYFMIGLSVLLALGIAWVVYRSIASPLDSLAYGMKQVRTGNLNIRLSNNRKDELGYLTGTFNQMVDDQRQLIQGYYEQQLRLSKTELKFLQSQINPHFLYNTLDSIYWMANQYEANEIKEMVLNLSKFFRLSLNKGRETFPLRETVDHLHYYIRIQQIRFSQRVSVQYDISEDSAGIPVLKLLLQPIVENAILHGLEKQDQHGELKITSRLEQDRLVLSVKDNGVGLPPDRLRYIQHELGKLQEAQLLLTPFEEEGGKDDLFGLRNVTARMKMYYGAEAGLTITSKEGEGTEVILWLPLEKCEVYDESADR
ncbi:sensor histidine kinase [Paenibacillus mesophilus]|uniref:cache domain-containing sensor histidine kinase n=1 Tax=Paenibacillus mesophilus TaxID=2582849 RepID=UPI00110DDEFE|nr:sensor histidine kinase [Paenibacillus mesophilus]TMV50741.1 sensor histidine kinase [Paenibacillus mesophilus]